MQSKGKLIDDGGPMLAADEYFCLFPMGLTEQVDLASLTLVTGWGRTFLAIAPRAMA